ncbi:MAG: methyltransferase domain-containing protein [candidate division Zixibacteria bacterium]|nr:methyltransferase domain-containing protein [candidate division Zixibacteria bacterium]
MKILEEKLKDLEGGRILDVATAYGDFTRFLTETFENYIEAIGIDMDQERLKMAQDRTGDEILYNPMNAENLLFDDDYFDTVAMRHSMHHLPDIDKVLSEMKRVLKPKGLLIIGELFQDPKTVKPNSHRHWHHWRAEVDRLKGESHNETLTKEEIIGKIDKMGFKDYEMIEDIDGTPDPDMEKIMQLNISESIEKLKEMGGQDDLIERGEKFQKIIKTLSYTPEGVLYFLARK